MSTIDLEIFQCARNTKITKPEIIAFAKQLKQWLSTSDFCEASQLFDYAIKKYDWHTATIIVLAAGISEQPLGADCITSLFPLIANIELLPLIVHALKGDCITPLIDVIASNRLYPDICVFCITMTGVLIELEAKDENKQFPQELIRQIRLISRKLLSLEAKVDLGNTVNVINDPALNERMASYKKMADAIERSSYTWNALKTTLSDPITTNLPEEEVKTQGFNFTARRAVKKIGRNEACPCGSGKKYKRCCYAKDQQRESELSPVSGVTMSEYKAHAHQYMQPGEFSTIPGGEILSIGLENLSTEHLQAVLMKFIGLCEWDIVLQALNLLSKRNDINTDSLDQYRLSAIIEALNVRHQAIIKQLLADMDRDLVAKEFYALNAIVISDNTLLSTFNSMAEKVFAGEVTTPLVDLCYSLLTFYPALGIFLTRGVIIESAVDEMEKMALLEDLEVARDHLLIPVSDPIDDYMEFYHDQQIDKKITQHHSEAINKKNQKLANDVIELRDELRYSTQHSEQLKKQLDKQQQQLDEYIKTIEDNKNKSNKKQNEKNRDSSSEHLKNKVHDLKNLLSEGKTERNNLRGQLNDLSKKLSSQQTVQNRVEEKEQHEHEIPASLPILAKPLYPVYPLDVRSAVEKAGPHLSAEVLQTSAQIASGKAGKATVVKKIQALKEVWSARIGIHYRLLFRFNYDNGEMELMDFIHRSELEKTINKLR